MTEFIGNQGGDEQNAESNEKEISKEELHARDVERTAGWIQQQMIYHPVFDGVGYQERQSYERYDIPMREMFEHRKQVSKESVENLSEKEAKAVLYRALFLLSGGSTATNPSVIAEGFVKAAKSEKELD